MVRTQHLNLSTAFPPLPTFDIVFIRNVLIYFDVQTKRSVLQRVASTMRPDGWLFLGSAETTIGIDDRFERVVAGRTSAYKLRTAPKTAASVSAVGKG